MVVNAPDLGIVDDRRAPTTTLAGWRQFVQDDPVTLHLLPEADQTGLDAAGRTEYDEARIKYHSELIVVETSTVRDVIRQGRLLSLLNQREVCARRGLIVSGAAATGKSLIYRGWGLPHALARDIHLPHEFGHENWPADTRDPVHRAAVYPEVVTLTELLVSPHWRPFAMSASTADRDRFRTEFQRRLPPGYHDLANTDLQLFAIVRHSPVAQWHDPQPETYPSTPTQTQGANR